MGAENRKAAVGCVMTILALLIVTPLWVAMWYGVLTHIDAPTWVWTTFWVYAPVSFVLALMRAAAEAIAAAE